MNDTTTPKVKKPVTKAQFQEWCREAAQELYGIDGLDIEDQATVEVGDSGVHVQCWIYLSPEEIAGYCGKDVLLETDGYETPKIPKELCNV